MTVLGMHAARPHRLRASVRAVRRVLPRAGCGLPAALLTDPLVSAWVRAHGVTVHARGGDELALIRGSGVAPEQVMWRCGATAVSISGALTSGVTRFVACTEHHLEVLAAFSGGTAAVHLDLGCPVSGPDALGVIGMHCEIRGSEPDDWAAAAGRLLGRLASMRSRGAEVTRISLLGGSATPWLRADKQELTSIASAVDEAIDDGCARWRLARPAVTLGPSRSG